MAELESVVDADGAAAAATVVELPTTDGLARVRLPADADVDEVAALVAAVATRLDGRAEPGEDRPEPVDGWRLAARLGTRQRYELPRQCRRGEEWKAAGRRPRP